ncbi:MAG: prolipoprotein diacylglyceryl transferase [Phycisphaerae bacterium]
MPLLAAWKFNLDPVLFELGFLELRYYGLIFAITLLLAFLLWRWQMRRGNYPRVLAENFLIYGVLATIVGARLGHVIFYEPGKYFSDPVQILYFWEGGLASHGATIGLVIALLLYCRRWKLPILETCDRFAFSAAIGSAGIRLGNFLNSEIVGRAWDGPWAVIFVRHDRLTGEPLTPRHPSQLYEFAMGLMVLGILVLIDRMTGKEKRPLAMLTGAFLTLYFGGRFVVEFFKAYQTLTPGGLTMGQVLSIIPVFIGAGLLIWSLRTRKPTAEIDSLNKGLDEPVTSRRELQENSKETRKEKPVKEKRRRRRK